MLVGVYNKKTKECIATADIDFGLSVYFIDDCNGMDKEELDQLLQSRLQIPWTYEMDNIVLEKLWLSDRKYEFGRMSEAKVLYMMLNYFESDEDDLCIHPLENELVTRIGEDFRYSNIYVWRTFYDTNA